MTFRRVTVEVVERRDPESNEINGALAWAYNEAGERVGFAEGKTGYEAACEALATVDLPVEDND